MRSSIPLPLRITLLPLLLAFVFIAGAAEKTEDHRAIDVTRLHYANSNQITAFFKSEEYRKLDRSDSEFLSDLYRGIFRREPDAGGFGKWMIALKNGAKNPEARDKAVRAFLASTEYAAIQPKPDTTRNPGNVIFDKTGVLVNDAHSLPADRFAPLFRKAKIEWVSLQIDNGGNIREDNVAVIKQGWIKAWREAGFKVGFWGCPRGVSSHNSEDAVKKAIPLVEADAALGVKLTVEHKGDFYIADCEDHYQAYNRTDPAPTLNRIYVEAFRKATAAAGIPNIPRALSSMGRVALDMKPWIDAGWDAMPQAYWNSYAVYQPSKCFDFYVKEAGWPTGRVHPTIATYSGEGENRTVSLQQYAADLETRPITGFSFYLPESYLRLDNEAGYEQLGKIGQ
jgi:hypothetical protein